MGTLTNAQIAAALEELGDLYELDGAIVHRVVAYRNAAAVVREATASVAELALAGRATELQAIGATLQEKIVALAQTGTIPATEKLHAKFPAGLVAVKRLPGVGPKRARALFDELGVDSLDALRNAASAGQVRTLRGFGEKLETGVLAALDAGAGEQPAQRTPSHHAREVGEQIVAALRAHPAAEAVELAGGLRRWTESVKDLDIVAASDDPGALTAALAGMELVSSSSSGGAAGARVVTHGGLPVDLRVVAPAQLGNLLQHFTGSRRHNVHLREIAVRAGLHVSEYGILDDATGTTDAYATEHEVYARVGLAYCEPELREDRGELEPGFVPPALVSVDDIRGDLHCHTVASDGRNTIEEMALAARDRGYEYLAITDHSATHGFGNHVTPDDLRRQIERVRALDAQLDGIRVLIGTETNILPDGSPDYDDDLLEQLDWVVGSIHTAFATPRAEMTKRVVTALEHPWIDCLGHPTGRLIARRDAYDLDLDTVIAAAARTGTMLEINANPRRRDLSDTYARAAVAAGVRIAISSDAHGAETLAFMRWGVATARRAWLGPGDVANTRSWKDFAPLRKRARVSG